MLVARRHDVAKLECGRSGIEESSSWLKALLGKHVVLATATFHTMMSKKAPLVAQIGPKHLLHPV